jgi:serine/threonine protein kinase/tetratricopeptide (TPR) repeat protein
VELEPGTVIDERYVVEGLLGTGGMAHVYRVRHRALGTQHALKLLTVSSPAVEARLLHEGRVQAALGHPNVIAVQDVVQVRGKPGLVLALVEGPSLTQLLGAQTSPLGVLQLDALAAGILAGVAAAHAVRLVHRDLKPSNVLIDLRRDAVVPMVGDFGLARALDDDADTRLTRSGASLGTPRYMAPEQIRSARSVDVRADVWSLGCLLYELATGVPPFTGDVLELYQRVAQGQYEPLSQRRPDLPERIVAAITAALQVDPDARPADAAALLALWAPAVGPAVDAPVWDPETVAHVRSLASTASVTSSTPSDPAVTWTDPSPTVAAREVRRTSMLGVVALAAVGLVGMGLLVALFASGPPPAEEQPAEPALVLPDGPHPGSSSGGPTPGSRQVLEASWEALQDARFADTIENTEFIWAGYDDPLPTLFVATASWASGQQGYADEALGKVDREQDERAQAIVAARKSDSMTAVAHEPYMGLEGDEGLARLDAWLEDHPRDPIALAWRIWADPGDADGQRARVAALRDALPDRALPWWFEAQVSRAQGRPGDAARAAERGLALDPGNPALLLERALAARDRGDFEAAARDLDGLVAAERVVRGAWEARAGVDLALEREEDRVRDVAARRSADVAVRFAAEHAAALAAAGRWDEARALLDDGLSQAVRYKYHAERVRLAAERVTLGLSSEPSGDPEGDLEALRAAYFALLDEDEDARGPHVAAMGRAAAALARSGRPVPEWLAAASP